MNYLAIFAASALTFGLGLLWYSPFLFGKCWMKLTKQHKKQPDMLGRIIMGFVGTFVLAWVLALLLDFVGHGWKMGLFWSFILWVPQGTVTLGGVLWEDRPWHLWFLNNSYNLLHLLIMGLMLGTWY